jgi:hypothetical protein
VSIIDYSLFLSDVNPSTTACPEFERLARIREAAQDFCRRSFLWRAREQALFTTVALQEVYDITALVPAGAQIVSLHSAWAYGREVDVEEPGQGDDFAPGVPDCRWVVGIDGPAALHVLPAPDGGGVAVTGTLSFCPSDDSTGVPDFIFNRWRREIASGAIEILCAQEGKAWTSPGLAALHGRKFDAAIMLAASRAGPVRRKGLRTQIQDAWPMHVRRRGCF